MNNWFKQILLKYSQKHIKNDLLQRRNYLTSKLLISPKEIINSMPKSIGPQFQGEWAIYSCAMFAKALANISNLYIETKSDNIQTIYKLIQIVLSPEIRAYDKAQWDNEDPIDSLNQGSVIKHLSYRSSLAWMICNYKLTGGAEEFDELLDDLCRALAEGIQNSPSLCLPTYQDMQVYLPDMLQAIVTLHLYGKIHDGKYDKLVTNWIYKVREKFIDENGLLCASTSYKGDIICRSRGSYSVLNTYYLSLIDIQFAKKQYNILKKTFVSRKGIITGCKEFAYNTNKVLTFDVDAGPIILDFSPSGTAFLIGCSTMFEDSSLRKKLLRTANLVGITVSFNNKRHYLLSKIALVGEAVVLAMKTSKI